MTQETHFQLHATITGRVQGVGFRYFVLQNALAHNLTGWVRNLGDGRVEVLAEGEHHSLNALLRALRVGPSHAEVLNVDYVFQEAQGNFQRFQLISTKYL